MTTIINLTAEQQQEFEAKRLKLLTPDLWTDAFAIKLNLTNMYIESVLAELMHLRAEAGPLQINCLNPLYSGAETGEDAYHELLEQCLTTPSPTKQIKSLRSFIETRIIGRKLNRVKWVGYRPDLRLLETIDEATSWLDAYLEI